MLRAYRTSAAVNAKLCGNPPFRARCSATRGRWHALECALRRLLLLALQLQCGLAFEAGWNPGKDRMMKTLLSVAWIACSLVGGLCSATHRASAADWHEGQPGYMAMLPDFDNDGPGRRSAETTCGFVMPEEGEFIARLTLAQQDGGIPYSTATLQGSGWSNLAFENSLPHAPQVYLVHQCWNPADPTIHYVYSSAPLALELGEVSSPHVGCPDWAPEFVQAYCSTVTSW